MPRTQLMQLPSGCRLASLERFLSTDPLPNPGAYPAPPATAPLPLRYPFAVAKQSAGEPRIDQASHSQGPTCFYYVGFSLAASIRTYCVINNSMLYIRILAPVISEITQPRSTLHGGADVAVVSYWKFGSE